MDHLQFQDLYPDVVILNFIAERQDGMDVETSSGEMDRLGMLYT